MSINEKTAVKFWLHDALKSNGLTAIDITVAERLARSGKPLLVVFVQDTKQQLEGAERLIETCDKLDIHTAL